jgi:hypothetical protein
MGKLIDIHDVDETNRRLISKIRLARTNCQGAQITGNNRNQPVMKRII